MLKKIFQYSFCFILLIVAGLYFTDTQGITDVGIFNLASVGASSQAICISVASIVEECGPNPGGTTKLYVIAKEDILTWPTLVPDGVTLTGNFVPKTGKAFAHWDFAEDTGEITHKSVGEAGSQAIEQEKAVYVSRMTPAIAAIINAALNRKFVIIFEDANGQKQVGGDERRQLKFDYDYKSGKKFSDKNGSEFKFSGGANHTPYFYAGTVPVVAAV